MISHWKIWIHMESIKTKIYHHISGQKKEYKKKKKKKWKLEIKNFKNGSLISGF